MRVARSLKELESALPDGRRVVVMTMGALHDGHLALVRRARESGGHVIVTIFVNPLQFTDPTDLQRYPRTLEADCTLLASEAVDVVFAPEVEDMYPDGDPIVTVSAGRIGKVFEGLHRPGHFDGVLTVVLKLFNLTKADVALFGEKDAQQLIAIRTMARDLALPVEIVSVPTVREADGLAMSSRNRFLSREERETALVLSGALMEARRRAESGEKPDAMLAAGYAVLAQAQGLILDYFDVIDPVSAEAVSTDYRGDVVIVVAARVGKTRLIDSMPATIQGDPE
ncbi:MAG: pantoate--beta-alanine ligase [Demequinaceae bacterium]|nr:pantoate--beta-alanine ligase [Demequinaceae bacterium]